jgi:hypothetical protein
MTEIVQHINSSDIKKLIWEFVGVGILGTPVGSMVKTLWFHSSERRPESINYADKVTDHSNVSIKNFLFFNSTMKCQKRISNLRHPKLDILEVYRFQEGIFCIEAYCGDRIYEEDYKNDKERCLTCYQIHHKLLTLDVETDHSNCVVCDKMLLVKEWITRYEHDWKCNECFVEEENEEETDSEFEDYDDVKEEEEEEF